MTHSTIVSTEALAGDLHPVATPRRLAIVDCRCDLHNENWGPQQYREGHIPNAVYASLSHDLAAPVDGKTGRHPLPSIDAMAATFGRLGIDRDTQVIAYDQDSGMYASRLWWMLRYLGHTAVAVLDGGWEKWTREGRPIQRGEEQATPRQFVADVQPELRADLAMVSEAAAQGMLLLDARAPERFEGKTEPLDRLPGHIPGAANHFFKQNLAADGTMLPAETLRTQLTGALHGRTPAQTIAYCGSGVSACHNLLAMEVAGLPGARLYVGSWSEWSSDPARPVETGPSRVE